MTRTYDQYATERNARLSDEGKVAVAVFSHAIQAAPVVKDPGAPAPTIRPFDGPAE